MHYLLRIFVLNIIFFKGKKKKDEPHWVEVVTDLMLSLLSQNRHVLRQVVNSVTGLLCPHMTQKALMAIMEVINPLEEDANEDEDMDEVCLHFLVYFYAESSAVCLHLKIVYIFIFPG